MTIEVSSQLERQLRDLASKQGRDIVTLVDEALRQYIEAAAITDVEHADVAATQIALASEINDVSEWNGERP